MIAPHLDWDIRTTMSTIMPRASADGPHRADDQLPEAAARAAERDLRVILDNVPALVNTVTPTGEIDFANRQLLDYLGVSLEELQDWVPFIHESDRPMVIEGCKHSVEGGQPFEMEFRLRRSDGVYRWFRGHAVPVRAQDGSIVRWYNLVTDIENRKRVDDQLHSSERQLRAIVDNIPAMIAIHNESGELELENRAAQEYHGRLPGETKQSATGDVVHPDDVPAFIAATQRALMTGRPLELEQRLRGGDGVYRWFHVRSRRSSDDYDGGSRWYTVGTDIHDRKTAEEGLRRSETRLLEVQRLSRTGAWRYDLAADIVESSPEIQRVYAAQPGEDISRPSFWFDRIHPEDRARVQAEFERCVREKTEYQAGYRIVLPDGSIRYQYATGHPVTNDAGELVEFIGASMDMTEHWLAATERGLAEEALRESERRSRLIVDSIPGLFGLLTADGDLQFLNRQILDYTGMTLEELKRRGTSDTIHPEDLPHVRQVFTQSIAAGSPYEIVWRFRRSDGVYRWFQNNGFPVRDTSGHIVGWCVLMTDIDDRKNAEDALHKSEERWRAVFENSAIGVALTDLRGRFLATNTAFQKMLGYTEEEIGNLTFLELTHEDYRESNWQLVKELLEGKRRQFQIEKQYRRKDGNLIWVSNNVSLVPGTKSMPRFLMALSEDITERKQTEEALRRSQAELAHVTRVASLGEMTASIAHEVNQPLAAVVANGHACLRWLSASPPNVAKAVEAAERIVKDGKDAGEVVRRVRALFRRTAVEKVQLDLGEVIVEVIRLLDGYPARKHVSLDVVLDPQLPPVFADRVQLQQLVLNLTVNALEALEPVSGRPKQLSVRSKRAEPSHAVIQISDNGIGLDDPAAAFEPFVTTKPEGMGLGLAICQSIVAAHEGTLSAERNAGFGMTFTVSLPIQRVSAR
jgi:PAS domain S-box-containing protein